MGYFFSPPLIKDRPPFLPDSSELEKSLWAALREPHPRCQRLDHQ